jgi:hypothetical protein
VTCRLLSLSDLQAQRQGLSRALYGLAHRRPSPKVTAEMRRLSGRIERLDRVLANAPRRTVVRLRAAGAP